MSLKEYRRKRDFEKTIEPEGKCDTGLGQRRFVVQKHIASHPHYDFRLEIEGVLKSWAVPKGIPFQKGEKRLAVQVEDHPISYIDFEGIIPAGQYGAGTVMVWDHGTFEVASSSPSKDLALGKLHVQLSGQKLQGEWHLVQLRDEKQWLLICGTPGMRPISRTLDDTSALSGRSMQELAVGARARIPGRRRTPAAKRPSLKSRPVLDFIEPMKAKPASSPPKGQWIYEIKLDGFRALALKESGSVRLLSRNNKALGERFPEVVKAVAQLAAQEAVLDGEIVALDSKGRPSFQLLQACELQPERPPIYFYAFDLLWLDGQDLKQVALASRKALLQTLVKNAPPVIRYSASLDGEAAGLLRHVRRLGLEGLIGKRVNSVYEAGRRTGAWIKLKPQPQQEFVIGGYTDPAGSRAHFGALLVGYRNRGRLRFAGKVGAGFDEPSLTSLHRRFRALEIASCPFFGVSRHRRDLMAAGVTAYDLKHTHWIKPSLVCQVKFSEWTREGKLRQPVFLGLRDDKKPSEVIRESPE